MKIPESDIKNRVFGMKNTKKNVQNFACSF